MAKILVDIDGVLNPFLGLDLESKGFTYQNLTPYAGWHLSVVHGQWLKELSKKHEVVWASAWQAEAKELEEYWGLPDGQFIEFKTIHYGETMKLPDIIKYAEKQPDSEWVVWIDDELGEDAHEWAASRPNTLLVECDPSVGWTEEQYQLIVETIDG